MDNKYKDLKITLNRFGKRVDVVIYKQISEDAYQGVWTHENKPIIGLVHIKEILAELKKNTGN